MIRAVGSFVGCEDKSSLLVTQLEGSLAQLRDERNDISTRPKVYFEEWYEPQITGIGWVSELIPTAGGVDCFEELSSQPLAKNRIVADEYEFVRQAPDIIIGSWCGKKFKRDRVVFRADWADIPAVRNGCIFEIDSSIILQSGPAALTDGVVALAGVIGKWLSCHSVSKVIGTD